MNKMNIEVMEQLLKDLAANVGYELIPNPFDTPFGEASLEKLPDDKQFIWPVPISVLTDDVHKDFRKMWIDADLINTVAELSLVWPNSEEERMAILLVDITRSRRGSVKFVDASDFDINDSEYRAGVCNMLIHDQYPGEYSLAFEVCGDLKDLWLDNPWNEQVCVVPARDVESFLPNDYIVKPNVFISGEHELLGELFDIYDSLDTGKRLKSSAIVISTKGKLNPMKIKQTDCSVDVSLDDKIILIPTEEYINLDYVLEQFSKEEVIRQLPIHRKIFVDDVWRVNIDVCDQLYLLSKEERDRIQMLEFDRISSLLEKGLSVSDIISGKEV